MRQNLEKADNLAVINNATVKEISGDKFVHSIKIASETGEQVIPVEGVFVEIGLIPNSGFIQGVEKNAQGEIKVNCRNETNIPGIFAAGDVTDVPEKQIIIAAGEGSKACLNVFKYLATKLF
jgi:alkyl hydroperoxide reductase subunit AhpF